MVLEFYGENNPAFDEFIVVKSTPTYLPVTNSEVTADALSTTVTSLSTTDIDECASNPCQHGRCENKDGGYKCACSPGWTGQNCQQGCPADWSKYNNHCYKLMTDKVGWYEAKKRCAKHGASLASVKDADENNFITGLILNAPVGDIPSVWLGLNKNKQSGRWKWTDGSRVGYNNWAPGEPNNIFRENCGSMYSKGSMTCLLVPPHPPPSVSRPNADVVPPEAVKLVL
ncbi:hypothetical protein Bbelb_193790 [Branchiostoma belcheri]|nr:hypothetical protein Bbelb_193790 [Branchiostoma belcheri]